MNWPGMSSLGMRRLVAEGTENSTRYLPFVGPWSAGKLYLPSAMLATTFSSLGSIAMNRTNPLPTGLPLSVTLPSSLPRFGGAGPRLQPTTAVTTSSQPSQRKGLGTLEVAQRFAGADAAGGDPGKEADVVGHESRAAIAHGCVDA